ncbi:MAG: GNAT family N-acetyltransferase [Anaerolineae bacterium]|nr:GNAT family N-acetyltransferase [Anaerolineae bacterium]
MNAGYAIRPARHADLDHLVALQLALQDHLEASNPNLWRMSDQARAQLKGQLAARLTAPDSCALVADHAADGVVGVIYGRVVTNKAYTPSRTGIVDQAVVLPHHRRRGVGARLVAELCRFFAAQGIDDLSLRYVTGNEQAAAFWTALGFTPRILTAGASRQVVEACLDRVQSP